MLLLSLFLEPSTTEHRDDGVIKVDLDDDSRHWPKETETFATSECTSNMFKLRQTFFQNTISFSKSSLFRQKFVC